LERCSDFLKTLAVRMSKAHSSVLVFQAFFKHTAVRCREADVKKRSLTILREKRGKKDRN